MPTYKYKVRDKFGKVIAGTIGGDSKNSVASHFESKGYTPVIIEEEAFSKDIPIFRSTKRVNHEDLNLFNRQLVTLVKAGVPLLAALSAVGKQTKSSVLRDTVQIITRDIEGGNSLSDAMKRHPYIFDELYVSTIKVGETSGAMDEIFARLADLGEHEADTKSKIKSATRYPLIALSVLAMGFLILVTYVIPRFMFIFKKYDAVLPLPTRILIWANHVIVNYWHIGILLAGMLIFGYKRFVNMPYGRRIRDTIRLKIPVFGPLFFMLTMSRFSRIMSIMLKSGVPILAVLDMVSKAAGNVIIADAIHEVMYSVNKGRGMAEPMARTKVFSPMVAQMVAIGEETGELDTLLMHVSEYYDQQANYMIKNLTTMLEPILVVILGCVVLLLALAIFLPMWNMLSFFRR
jgi:type II secretory pathway component PulF